MSKTWKGPCKELIATYSDPLAMRLHRRAGLQGIAYNVAHDGRSAEVFRMVKRADGDYHLPVLGTVEGGDPMNVFVNAALQYTEHDPELFALVGEAVLRRFDAVTHEIEDRIIQANKAADTLGAALAPLKRRYV